MGSYFAIGVVTTVRWAVVALCLVQSTEKAVALSCGLAPPVLQLYEIMAGGKGLSPEATERAARFAVEHAVAATDVIIEGRFGGLVCLSAREGRVTFTDVRWLKGPKEGHSKTAVAMFFSFNGECNRPSPDDVDGLRLISGFRAGLTGPATGSPDDPDFTIGSCPTPLSSLKQLAETSERKRGPIDASHAAELLKQYTVMIDRMRANAAAVAEAEAHPSAPAWNKFNEMMQELRKPSAP